MMADYENDISMTDAKFSLNHSTSDLFASLYCNVNRVWVYTEHRDNSTWVYQLADAFEEVTPPEEMSPSLN